MNNKFDKISWIINVFYWIDSIWNSLKFTFQTYEGTHGLVHWHVAVIGAGKNVQWDSNYATAFLPLTIKLRGFSKWFEIMAVFVWTLKIVFCLRLNPTNIKNSVFGTENFISNRGNIIVGKAERLGIFLKNIYCSFLAKKWV